MAERRPLLLLGATGSIGQSTLDLVRRYPKRFRVAGLACARRHEALGKLAWEFPDAHLMVYDEAARAQLAGAQPQLASRMAGPGDAGLVELIDRCPGTLVVNALVGAVGLAPTVHALRAGHDVALANKEALVVGGHLVQEAAKEGRSRLWPVDSEHSALAQCLRGNPVEEVDRLWLTASGGPFRDHTPEQLAEVTVEEVLDHPNWDMGPKVTVDSASMMNKGLEVIEAHWLFGIPYDRIEVVVHRQSIIHSLVELRDGAFLAQLGAPDMRVPILYALAQGEHWAAPGMAPWSPLDSPRLDFAAPDPALYPCLGLARRAGEAGGTAPIVLNAANEEAVGALLRSQLPFAELPGVIERALEGASAALPGSVDEALAADRAAREKARELAAASARTS